MADMVTLVVPTGADTGPISNGTVTYRPYLADPRDPASRWLVDVPADIVQYMTGVGGFTMAQTKAVSAADARADAPVVRMYRPDGGACDAFPMDDDGYVVVPNGEAVGVLRGHGFLVEGEEPPVPEVVDGEAHESLMQEFEATKARLAALEAQIIEHHRDNKMMRDQLDAKDGEIAKLHADLDAATKPAETKPEQK